MSKTLTEIVVEILKKKKGAKLTGHEIAEVIVKTEPEFIAKKVKRTQKTEKVLLFQLMSEIGAQYHKLSTLNVTKTEDRPAKYYYKAPARKEAKACAAKSTKVAKAAKPAKKTKKVK